MAVGVSAEALPSACIVWIAVVGTFQGVSNSSEKWLIVESISQGVIKYHRFWLVACQPKVSLFDYVEMRLSHQKSSLHRLASCTLLIVWLHIKRIITSISIYPFNCCLSVTINSDSYTMNNMIFFQGQYRLLVIKQKGNWYLEPMYCWYTVWYTAVKKNLDVNI